MPEPPAEPTDADLLGALARRVRDDPSFVTVTPSEEDTDEGPAMGALDVFADATAVTVTVETRNADPSNIHVSLLGGRLLIGLGEGPGACKRDLPLPVAVDEEHAVATFRNGILDVVLPVKRR